MERDPKPTHPEQSAPRPEKRVAFFEKWKRKRQSAEVTQPNPEQTPKAPEAEAPVRPERSRFGKNITRLLFGEQRAAEPARSLDTPEAVVAAPTPEAPTQEPQTPEQSPHYERATRMRRLARVILANVLGQANREPGLARARGEREPLSTQPLTEAAQDLQLATETLDTTIEEAQQPSTTEVNADFGGNYDMQPARAAERERAAPVIEQAATERIDRRLRRLEAAAEEHRAASVAAVGLGVLAVLLSGTEYFGRKRADRKIARETNAAFAVQEKAMADQRAEFNTLRQEQERMVDMNRNQRQNYYERLSTYTLQQAERTRETERELREVVIAHAPEAVAAPVVQQGDMYERRQWQPRQPERVQAAPQVEREPQPIARVEKTERTEQQPGQQTGSAGTGFFGGGGGGIASGTGPSDLSQPRTLADPHSPEARKLEELRKAEQARLQQNAWLYGAALIATLGTLLAITIFIG